MAREGQRGEESIVGAEYRLGQEELNMGAEAIRVPGSTLVLEAASRVPVLSKLPAVLL